MLHMKYLSQRNFNKNSTSILEIRDEEFQACENDIGGIK